MEKWGKVKIVSTLIGTIVIPIMVTYMVQIYTEAIKERELEGRFVELGVSILQQQPTPDTQNLRKWAIDILARYSGVPISESTKKELTEQISIPRDVEKRIREYSANAMEDLLIDNIHFRLTRCTKVENQFNCSIDIQPDESTGSIKVIGLPSMGSPEDPFFSHESTVTLGKQKLINLNYPVSKKFLVKPGTINKMEFTSYFGSLDWFQRETFSFRLGFDVGYGRFHIVFTAKYDVGNSE